jgi:hypothetical protein
MFCPNCKTEYRVGFTKCSDCRVDLVSKSPVGESGDDAYIPRNSEGLELLWSGVSEALTDQIDDALEAAHVSHKITDKEFGLLPNLAQSANFIWIESRDRASSRAILEKVLAGSGALEQEAERYPPDGRRMNPLGLGRKIYGSPVGDHPLFGSNSPFDSASLFEAHAASEPVPDDIVEDFDPGDATADVWSGDDEMAEYLKLCFSGVGIGCVLREDGSKIHVFVLPANEIRAREIVREVVDAAPPQ